LASGLERLRTSDVTITQRMHLLVFIYVAGMYTCFRAEFYICLFFCFRLLLWKANILGLTKRSSILAIQVEVMTLMKMILMRLGSELQSYRKRVENLVAISIPEP
jgi:hypothetical protein